MSVSNLSLSFHSPEYAAGYDADKSKSKFQQFKNSHKRNPVPEEARRWLRQAKADLKSAYNDHNAEEPAHEWALLKCYQVSLSNSQPPVIEGDSSRLWGIEGHDSGDYITTKSRPIKKGLAPWLSIETDFC